MPKDQKNLVPIPIRKESRPPVVVIMGHIDHGKSTLLDHVRKTEVVKGEAGGITQHVGAYEAEHTGSDGKKHPITFLDTPGHEAFCSIRERGAQAADIAILVVSAEDGVKPQTLEAWKNIKDSKIPYIVAINKIDKPNSNVDKVKTNLGENEIYVEGWGGDIPCVAISALKGTGVSELLDLVILSAQLADLGSDPSKPASGIVIESELNTRKGISATLLIKDGTLTTGSFVVAGSAFTPVRFIENFNGEKIETAKASMPVVLLGWNEIPSCGSPFTTVRSKKDAERKATENRAREEASRPKETIAPRKKAKGELAADQFGYKKEESGMVILPLIVKTDVIGSLEGVRYELAKIKDGLRESQALKIQLKIISEGIGDVNENDVKLAESDPNIVVVGFNVASDKKAAAMIERSAVPLSVKTFKIIYELVEFVRASLLAKIPREYVEQMIGRAKILALFSHEKDRQVVGGKVETGMIESGNDIRIMRRDNEIGRGKIRELQEKKIKTGTVAEGHEFGVKIEAKIEIAVGDRIEAVRTVEKVS